MVLQIEPPNQTSWSPLEQFNQASSALAVANLECLRLERLRIEASPAEIPFINYGLYLAQVRLQTAELNFRSAQTVIINYFLTTAEPITNPVK